MSRLAQLITTLTLLIGYTASLVVDKYDRDINLSGFNVVIKETLEVTDDAKQPLTSISLCYSSFLDSKAALSQVLQDDEVSSLSIKAAGIQLHVPDNVTCVDAVLKNPVKKGQKVILKTVFIATHAQIVFPAEITQLESQSAAFTDFVHGLSPYEIKEQTTSIKLSSPRIHTYTKLDPVSKEGSTVTYGPYMNTPPFKLVPMRLHYENNKPFVEIRKLEREIQISHWGNIYVDENYDILHAGAKVTGMWSRLDFSQGQTSKSGYSTFTAVLPKGANTVYYRDDIGNVSTSNVRFEKEKVVAQLRVRYPLFGGWACKFLFGYSLPLSNVMTYAKDGSRQLKMKFSSPFVDEHVIDDLEVRIVFPEGASHIRYSTPFSVEEKWSKKWSYLDTTGREVLVLRKANVVNSLNLDFTVNYQFPVYDVLHEPLLLMAAFFVLFLTIIIGFRIDVSVGRDESSKKQAQIFDLVQKIESILSEHKRLGNDVNQWVAALSTGASRSEAERVKSKAEKALKQDTEKLNNILQQLKAADAKIVKGFETLVEKDKQLIEQMIALLTMSLSGKSGDAGEKGAALKNTINQLKQELSVLSQAQFSGY